MMNASRQQTEDKNMNQMIKHRERGVISPEMAKRLKLGEVYNNALTKALLEMGVHDGDIYFANDGQAMAAKAIAEKAMAELQARFDKEDEQASINAENNRVNKIVSVLSGNLRGVTYSFCNEFDAEQFRTIGVFQDGAWVTAHVSELTNEHKEQLRNGVTNDCRNFASIFCVCVDEDANTSSTVDDGTSILSDGNTSDEINVDAEFLKAARKAAKAAEKAAKVAAKKGR